jgi:hypothetical protein
MMLYPVRLELLPLGCGNKGGIGAGGTMMRRLPTFPKIAGNGIVLSARRSRDRDRWRLHHHVVDVVEFNRYPGSAGHSPLLNIGLGIV